jgi:Fe-S cluster biogenesis protein NfuA
MKYWIKQKILNHLNATGGRVVFIRRNYHTNIVVVDYLGGACVKYYYDGKWICG